MFLDRVGRLAGPLALMLLIAACTPGGDRDDPAPASATAAADFVAVGTAPPSAPATSPLLAVGLTATTLPTDATVVGPHYAVRLESVAVTDRLSQAQRTALGLPGGDGELRPAAGSEFLVVHAADRAPAVSLLAIEGAKPTAAVLVGGGTRPLRGGVPAANAVLVVSVPVGGSGVLVITDLNRTQSVDLRSGKPGTDVNPLFYPQWRATAEVSEQDRVNGIDRSIRVTVDLAVTLRPYLPGRDWAPVGRAWLAVDVTMSVPNEVGLRLDLTKSLTLRADGPLGIPGGTVLVAAPDPGGTSRVARWSGGFSVPAGLRTVTANFVTVGTYSRAASGATLGYTAHPVGSGVTLHLNPVR
jgi:hypothetical protein